MNTITILDSRAAFRMKTPKKKKIQRSFAIDKIMHLRTSSVLDSMSNEEIAVAVAIGGIPHLSVSKDDLSKRLFVSVKAMVYDIASKFRNMEWSIDDLVQDCFATIFAKIDRFDPSKGKFTTWSWWITSNILKKKYMTAKRNSHIRLEHSFAVDGTDLTERSRDFSESEVSLPINKHDVEEMVSLFVDKHPQLEDIVVAMFGVPKTDSFHSDPSRVVDVSRATGVAVSNITKVYKKQILPFFRRMIA